MAKAHERDARQVEDAAQRRLEADPGKCEAIREERNCSEEVSQEKLTNEVQPARWPELMKKEDAAAYWSIKDRKFQELVSSGVISGRKLGPRCIRYSRRELDEAALRFPQGKGKGPAQ